MLSINRSRNSKLIFLKHCFVPASSLPIKHSKAPSCRLNSTQSPQACRAGPVQSHSPIWWKGLTHMLPPQPRWAPIFILLQRPLPCVSLRISASSHSQTLFQRGLFLLANISGLAAIINEALSGWEGISNPHVSPAQAVSLDPLSFDKAYMTSRMLGCGAHPDPQQNTPLLCSILSALCNSLPLLPHYHTPYPTSGPFMKLPDSTKEPCCLCSGCGSGSYLNFGGLMLLKLFGGVCQIPSQPQLCNKVLYRKEKEKGEGREGGRGAERQQE